MKSKIDIRVFAIEQAMHLYSAGSPAKDVVAKAKEIELYILGNIELPDTYDDITNMLGGAIGLVGALNSDDNKVKKK